MPMSHSRWMMPSLLWRQARHTARCTCCVELVCLRRASQPACIWTTPCWQHCLLAKTGSVPPWMRVCCVYRVDHSLLNMAPACCCHRLVQPSGQSADCYAANHLQAGHCCACCCTLPACQLRCHICTHTHSSRSLSLSHSVVLGSVQSKLPAACG